MRTGHSAVHLKNNKVLILGGPGGMAKTYNSIELYDPEAKDFQILGKLDCRRSGLAAQLIRDNQVLISGGDSGGRICFSPDIVIYDVNKNKFLPIANLKRPRQQHSTVVVSDGTVLIFGGITTDTPQEPVYEVEKLNIGDIKNHP